MIHRCIGGVFYILLWWIWLLWYRMNANKIKISLKNVHVVCSKINDINKTNVHIGKRGYLVLNNVCLFIFIAKFFMIIFRTLGSLCYGHEINIVYFRRLVFFLFLLLSVALWGYLSSAHRFIWKVRDNLVWMFMKGGYVQWN